MKAKQNQKIVHSSFAPSPIPWSEKTESKRQNLFKERLLFGTTSASISHHFKSHAV